MDPITKDKVRFYVGDVGAKVWEELNECGTGFEAKNYGWHVREGPYARNSDTDCSIIPEYQDPIYWYAHRRFTSGGAITGGAFVPTGIWPPAYDRTYILTDYTFREIYHLVDGGDDRRLRSPPSSKFKNTKFHNANAVLDMFFGPYADSKA
jgi:hypothetical protein